MSRICQGSALLSHNYCELCRTKPKYVEGTKEHPYCSKSCASAAKLLLVLHSLSISDPGNCLHCRVRPKYNDGTRTHDYCSKACASIASASASNATLANMQQGLTNDVCLMCRRAKQMRHMHFCGQKCLRQAESRSPMLLEIPASHATFKSVENQFSTSWRHQSPCPSVKHVFYIVNTQQVLTRYRNYRALVEQKGQFVAQGRREGNENRRWHGTKRKCTVGDNGNTQLCNDSGCSLCSIVKGSFDISRWGTKTGWGRFGKGIYTSSTSSKSDGYSSNDPASLSPNKAMLLNTVVVGKGCKLLNDNPTLTAPPAGYDSVLAEVGGSLLYDELIVYQNDAIRPLYLVIY